MSDKKKSSMKKSKFLYNLFMLVPTVFNLINNISRIIKRDIYIAGKNIVYILILAIMLACLLTATWIGVLAVIFFCLIKLQWGFIFATLFVLLLNILLLLLILRAITIAKQHIAFTDTQRQLGGKID